MNRATMLCGLAASLLLTPACATLNKFTSVVDSERIDAVQDLANWKQQALRRGRAAPANCERSYSSAQGQVNGWIDGELLTQITTAAGQSSGSIDLGMDRIPSRVSAAVAEFQVCAPDVLERGSEAIDAAKAVLEWALLQAKNKRKESADELKEQLKGCRWPDWSDVRAGG